MDSSTIEEILAEVERKLGQVKIQDGTIVDIASASFKSFNRLYVVPTNKLCRLKLMELLDEIQLCVRKQDKGLGSLPSIGDVVVGKIEQEAAATPKFARCVVLDVMEKAGKVLVNYLDFGENKILKLDELKEPNKAILKFPIFACQVELYEVPELPDEISWSSYINYICTTRRTGLTLKLVEDKAVPVVCLYSGYNEKKLETNFSINKGIMDLVKKDWPWQMHLKAGNATDRFMKKQYNSQPVMNFAIEVRELDIDIEDEMFMKIANYGCAEAIVCIPKSDIEIHNFDVLDRQIRKYVSTVRVSGHYPHQYELCFGRMRTKKGQTALPWRRCYRQSTDQGNVVFDIDTGEKNDGKGYEYRYMPPDFIQPAFAMCCKIAGNNVEVTEKQEERLSEILKRGSCIKFKIEGIDDERLVLNAPEIRIALSPELIAVPTFTKQRVHHQPE